MSTHHDDDTVGRLFSRREAIALLGTTSAAFFAARLPELQAADAAMPSCIVRPQQTEGPYFVEERLQRSDIRSDPAKGDAKPGLPLALTLVVSRVSEGSCQPLSGAHVDLWQCDALGVYSDVTDPSFNTVGQKFLRGYQVTDTRGQARFVTVYPGAYQGRTVHIHFKVRTDPSAARGREFTSQLYFDDALTDRVHAAAPYSARGKRSTRNRDDGIFRRGGEQLLLSPAEAQDGLAATFALGLQIA